MLGKAARGLELPMEHNLKPDLEPEAQLLRQQIAELTKANVALQTELAERRRTEEALRTDEVARVYQELNKLKRAEQLARRQTAALTRKRCASPRL